MGELRFMACMILTLLALSFPVHANNLMDQSARQMAEHAITSRHFTLVQYNQLKETIPGNVRTGNTLAAKPSGDTAESPYMNAVIQYVLTALLLALLALLFWVFARSRKRVRLQFAGHIWQQMVDELHLILHTMRQIRSAFTTTASDHLKTAFSDLEFEIGILKDKIASRRWGGETAQPDEKTEGHSKQLSQQIRAFRESCEQMLQKAQNGEIDPQTISELERQLRGFRHLSVNRHDDEQ